MMRVFSTILLACCIVAVIAGGVAIFNRHRITSSQPKTLLQPLVANLNRVVPTLSSPEPSPSPVPFAELTIPHLRQRSYQSQLNEQTLVSETATYTSYRTSYDSDGLTIYGQLTIPKTTPTQSQPTQGWPAIIFLHGYIPPTLYRTFDNYAAYVDALARQGFVVFKIDLRGHDQSEGEASGAYYAPDYIIDTLNAYAALQKSGFVNPHGIGLFGHSMAGNVSLRAAVTQLDIPAVVIWAGAVYTYQDMRDFGIDDNSYRPPQTSSNRQRQREQLRAIHGEFAPTSSFWQQVVPTNYLDGVTTDFQFHHPVDDAVVSVEYSRNVVPLLQAAGLTAELHEYPTGGHNLTGQTFSAAMTKTVQFFHTRLE